jgi:PAS domain S-box-containing protein
MKRYPSASITPAPPSASNKCMARSALATFRIADLAQLLEAAVDAMVITRSDGRIVGVNTKTETLFGYSREELLGQKPEMLMSLHLATLRWSRFRKRYVKPRTRNDAHSTFHLLGLLKLEGRRRDGSKFPMEISMGLMEWGGETLLSSAIQDITERTRTEELAAHLASIVEASDDAITGETMDGTIVSWNKGAERLYGYKAEEMLEHSTTALIPPDKTDEFPAIMEGLSRGQSLESYETTRIHKDRHPIDVSVTISPVKKAGKIVGASVVARDITTRKQAEAALRLSEERLRVAIKNAPVVVSTQDLRLRYTWITPPVMAWDHREYVGCTDAELFGGEQGARLTAIKQEVLRSGVGSHNEVTITLGGVTHYFDLVVDPLRDGQGTPLGIISSAVETTPWKELIVKLQVALDEVQLLSGLLSICSSCKRIKDEHAIWQPLEVYIQAHSEAEFTHGLCPDCLRKLYPEYYPQ